MNKKTFLILALSFTAIIGYLIIADNSWLKVIDVWMIRKIFLLSGNEVITGVMNWLTNYTIGSLTGLAVVFSYLLYIRRWREAWVFVQSGLVLFALAYLVKDYWSRIRPYEYLTSMDSLANNTLIDKYSFFSSHAAFSFFAAFFLSEIIWYKSPWKYWIYVLATLVALSRLYLGVHYVSDVLVGVLVGLMAGMMAKFMLEMYRQSKK